MVPEIAGLRYIPEYIDVATHDQLLTAVDEHPWLNGVDHQVQVYGYQYNRRDDVAYPIGPLPAWAQSVAVRLWHDGFVPSAPDQLVANAYPVGTGIFPHVDQAAFGATIVALSLGSACVMEFTRPDAQERAALLIAPRSLLVLTDAARWQWRHEIPARVEDEWGGQVLPRTRRVSLTFRLMPPRTSAL